MHKHNCLRWLSLFVIGCFCSVPVFAQLTEDEYNAQFNRMDRSAIFLPVTFAGSPTIGSPWYSRIWVPGQVSFTNGQSLPLPGDVLYMNYDKSANRVFFKKGDSIVAFRGADVEGFRLDDSAGIHSFTRVARLSTSNFVEVLVEPGPGLSLYKRTFSRLRAADYMDVGYTTTGSRSARYVDDVEYYLLQADGKTYSHFYLSNSGLRQKLGRMNGVAKKFMDEHPGPVNQAMLITFCEAMNEKTEAP